MTKAYARRLQGQYAVVIAAIGAKMLRLQGDPQRARYLREYTQSMHDYLSRIHEIDAVQ